MTKPKVKLLVQILAGPLGVYEIGVRGYQGHYDKAERLQCALRPAIDQIDAIIKSWTDKLLESRGNGLDNP